MKKEKGTMQTMTSISVLSIIFSTCAAFILVFLIAQILLIMHRVDKDMLKARIFLNDSVMNWTWMYLSIAGATFALNSFVKLMISYTKMGQVFIDYYVVELTELLFLIAFILAVYRWYVFIEDIIVEKAIKRMTAG